MATMKENSRCAGGDVVRDERGEHELNDMLRWETAEEAFFNETCLSPDADNMASSEPETLSPLPPPKEGMRRLHFYDTQDWEGEDVQGHWTWMDVPVTPDDGDSSCTSEAYDGGPSQPTDASMWTIFKEIDLDMKKSNRVSRTAGSQAFACAQCAARDHVYDKENITDALNLEKGPPAMKPLAQDTAKRTALLPATQPEVARLTSEPAQAICTQECLWHVPAVERNRITHAEHGNGGGGRGKGWGNQSWNNQGSYGQGKGWSNSNSDYRHAPSSWLWDAFYAEKEKVSRLEASETQREAEASTKKLATEVSDQVKRELGFVTEEPSSSTNKKETAATPNLFLQMTKRALRMLQSDDSNASKLSDDLDKPKRKGSFFSSTWRRMQEKRSKDRARKRHIDAKKSRRPSRSSSSRSRKRRRRGTRTRSRSRRRRRSDKASSSRSPSRGRSSSRSRRGRKGTKESRKHSTPRRNCELPETATPRRAAVAACVGDQHFSDETCWRAVQLIDPNIDISGFPDDLDGWVTALADATAHKVLDEQLRELKLPVRVFHNKKTKTLEILQHLSDNEPEGAKDVD